MNPAIFLLSLGELLQGFPFCKVTNYFDPFCGGGGLLLNLNMAKAIKKKTAKEASELFHNIMKASVSGNPKPKNKINKKP